MHDHQPAIMLTTAGSSQYLHPDYIQPLPTTLDAKKSPLALLAQTCSSIGKDSPSASNSVKSIIPPIERKDAIKDKDKNSTGRSKSASPGSKSSPAPDRSLSQPSEGEKRDENLSPHKSTPSPSRSVSPKSGFKAPTSSSSGKSSTPPKSPSSLSKLGGDSTSTTSVMQQPTPSTSTSSQTNSRISINCGNMMLEVNHEAKVQQGSMGTHLPGTLRPDLPPSHLHPAALPPHLAAAYPGLHLPLGLGHPLDPTVTNSAYAAALSAHGSFFKHGSLPSSAALSSYLNYARMKSPNGGSLLVPPCKDPYCGHCQSSPFGSSMCAAGCNQCTHDKSIPTSVAHSAALGALPLYPGALGATPTSLALSSLYPHAFGALPAHQGLPFVCNWVSGTDYCGKRFTTSEELLQHLRTHTSDASALAAAALPYAGLGLPAYQSHLAAAATAGSSGSISPNSALRGSLGRSLSPTNLLAASRFHPYKSPLSSLSVPLPSGARLPVSLPSPLTAHYNPSYWAEAQRLGAAVTP